MFPIFFEVLHNLVEGRKLLQQLPRGASNPDRLPRMLLCSEGFRLLRGLSKLRRISLGCPLSDPRKVANFWWLKFGKTRPQNTSWRKN